MVCGLGKTRHIYSAGGPVRVRWLEWLRRMHVARILSTLAVVLCVYGRGYWILGFPFILISSDNMLQGLWTNGDCQYFGFHSSHASLLVPTHTCVLVSMLFDSSSFERYTTIVLSPSWMHVSRWLVSVFIVFSKRLADFLKILQFCTIPTWIKSGFLHGN